MYRNILVPIDLEEDASHNDALRTAIELCRAFDATLHAMTVIPDYGMTVVGQYFPKGAADALADRALGELKALTAKMVPAEIKQDHLVGRGSIYQKIIEAGVERSADLIVMGAHRPALSDYLLGSNAAKVVRHYDHSVLIVRPGL